MRPLLVVLSLALGLPGSASADRLSEVLAAMKDAGDALRTLTAEFSQTDHDYILEDEEQSSGKLFFSVPGRIRWEYEQPHPRVLLVKNDLVRLYNPAAAQVQEFDRSKGGHSGGMDLLVGFGSGNEKIGENYDAELVEETNTDVVLKLVPKPDSAASIFTAIELTIDKSNWTPKQSTFHEPNKDRTEIRFDHVVVNGKLKDAVFKLELPAGVEIVRN